jgi:hypothetical protein
MSEKYISETSVTSKIDDFLGVIKSSVDTPAIPTCFKELDLILDDGLYEDMLNSHIRTNTADISYHKSGGI